MANLTQKQIERNMGSIKQGDIVLVDGNGLYANCMVHMVPAEGYRALCGHISVGFLNDAGTAPHAHDLRQFWVMSENCTIIKPA